MAGVIVVGLLVLSSLIWSMTGGKKVTSCNNISIKCDNNYWIVIKDANTSSNILQNIIQQCNAHHQCNVTYPNNCIEINYWCRMNIPMSEIWKSSIAQLKRNVTFLGFTSEGYMQGMYQDAENITCNLTIEAEQNCNETHIIIHELASFDTPAQFCLSMTSTQSQQICSSSAIVGKEYGPFEAQEKCQFNIRLTNAETFPPRIRFWIDIKGPQDRLAMYHLECQSYPAAAESTQTVVNNFSETKSSDNKRDTTISAVMNEVEPTKNQMDGTVIYMMGTLLGLVIAFVISLVAYFIFRSGRIHGLVNGYHDVEESIYADIDLSARNEQPYTIIPYHSTRGEVLHTNIPYQGLVPDITLERQILENLLSASHLMNSVAYMARAAPQEGEVDETSCSGSVLSFENQDLDQSDVSDEITIVDNPHYEPYAFQKKNDSGKKADDMKINATGVKKVRWMNDPYVASENTVDDITCHKVSEDEETMDCLQSEANMNDGTESKCSQITESEEIVGYDETSCPGSLPSFENQDLNQSDVSDETTIVDNPCYEPYVSKKKEDFGKADDMKIVDNDSHFETGVKKVQLMNDPYEASENTIDGKTCNNVCEDEEIRDCLQSEANMNDETKSNCSQSGEIVGYTGYEPFEIPQQCN